MQRGLRRRRLCAFASAEGAKLLGRDPGPCHWCSNLRLREGENALYICSLGIRPRGEIKVSQIIHNSDQDMIRAIQRGVKPYRYPLLNGMKDRWRRNTDRALLRTEVPVMAPRDELATDVVLDIPTISHRCGSIFLMELNTK